MTKTIQQIKRLKEYKLSTATYIWNARYTGSGWSWGWYDLKDVKKEPDEYYIPLSTGQFEYYFNFERDALTEDTGVIAQLENRLKSEDDVFEFDAKNAEDAKKVQVYLDKHNISYFPTKFGGGFIFTISITYGKDNSDVANNLEGAEVSDDWEVYGSKSVLDSDGSPTDYTWYYNPSKDKHIFIFGDSEVYAPDEDYADWECDSYGEAIEWFNSYNGYDDDDLFEEISAYTTGTAGDGKTRKPTVQTYKVSYKSNGVYQIIKVRALSEAEAKDKFQKDMQKNNRQFVITGIKLCGEDKPGVPVLEDTTAAAEVRAILKQLVKRDNAPLASIGGMFDARTHKPLNGVEYVTFVDGKLLKMYNGDTGVLIGIIKVDRNAPCKTLLEDKVIKENKDANIVAVASDKDLSKILSLAKEIGIYTVTDLIKFINQESESGENLLDTIKRYREELGADFKIKNEEYEYEHSDSGCIIKDIADTYNIGIDDIKKVGNNLIVTPAAGADAKVLAKQLKLNNFAVRLLPNGKLQVSAVYDVYEKLSESIRSFVTRQKLINKDVKMQERYIGKREIKDLTEASDILAGYAKYSKEKH